MHITPEERPLFQESVCIKLSQARAQYELHPIPVPIDLDLRSTPFISSNQIYSKPQHWGPKEHGDHPRCTQTRLSRFVLARELRTQSRTRCMKPTRLQRKKIQSCKNSSQALRFECYRKRDFLLMSLSGTRKRECVWSSGRYTCIYQFKIGMRIGGRNICWPGSTCCWNMFCSVCGRYTYNKRNGNRCIGNRKVGPDACVCNAHSHYFFLIRLSCFFASHFGKPSFYHLFLPYLS